MKLDYHTKGKIFDTADGRRFMLVEQKGQDIWRGNKKTINHAVEEGLAGVGLDQALLKSAVSKHGVRFIIIAVAELDTIFIAPASTFLDPDRSFRQSNYRGCVLTYIPYEKIYQKYVGPNLRRKRKRAKTA